MTTFTSNSSTQNVHVGVCRVVFNGVDLGYTQGGVDVEVKTQTHQVMVDQFGKSVIDEIILGRTVTAKVPLAETTLENLVAIMPGATLSSDSGTPAKKKIDVPTGIGSSLRAIAKVLTLHPKALPDTDLSQDFTIPLAATSGALQFSYQLEKERIYSVLFQGYPDDSQKLFIVGDTTVA